MGTWRLFVVGLIPAVALAGWSYPAGRVEGPYAAAGFENPLHDFPGRSPTAAPPAIRSTRGWRGRAETAALPGGAGAALALLMAAAPAAAQPTMIGETDHLRIHSDAWINLHHFLYQWSRAEEEIGSGRAHVPVPERDELAPMDHADRETWRAAVDFYSDNLAERGHFDGVMLRIKNALVEREPGGPLPDEPSGLARRLDGAMEVYRERWWPGHDRANREWWNAARPYVVGHEAFLVESLERAFVGPWVEPLRVDISAYANWQGAYTSLRPDHTVLSSTDPGNQGLHGVEILFHEAGHQLALFEPNREGIRRAFEAAGGAAPANLWHAVIFETVGWAVQRVAQEEGVGPYLPYAESGTLRTLRGWSELWPALDAHWVPFLEGAGTREEALEGLARWFGEARSQGSPSPSRGRK